eukprot:11222186-Lingulodinium_polyedra.AAC.1
MQVRNHSRWEGDCKGATQGGRAQGADTSRLSQQGDKEGLGRPYSPGALGAGHATVVARDGQGNAATRARGPLGS